MPTHHSPMIPVSPVQLPPGGLTGEECFDGSIKVYEFLGVLLGIIKTT